MILGCHVSMKAPDYVEGSVREALSYKADALMLYTGAPQNTVRIPVERLHVREAEQLMKEHGMAPERMIVHAPYLINLANPSPDAAAFSKRLLRSEMARTHALGAKYLILHPGAALKQTPEEGIRMLAENLNAIGNEVPDVLICLETMAGKGSEIGTSLEQLAQILSRLDHPERFGICFDTCHTNDAGYVLQDFDAVLDQFDRVIGLDRLKVIHLNDSLNVRGSHKDRHANLGLGTIGFDVLYKIASNPRTEKAAKILETPWMDGKPPYLYEIAMLRSGRYDPAVWEKLKKKEDQ